MLLRNGFTAEGCVSLHGAKIGGNLECDGAHLANHTENGSGNALLAQGAEIGGAALLRNGFTAEGCVSLLDAKIGGLDCDFGDAAQLQRRRRRDYAQSNERNDRPRRPPGAPQHRRNFDLGLPGRTRC